MTPQDIRALRTSLHLSRKELAARLGVSFRTVEGWELGKHSPPGSAVKLMERMAKEKKDGKTMR